MRVLIVSQYFAPEITAARQSGCTASPPGWSGGATRSRWSARCPTHPVGVVAKVRRPAGRSAGRWTARRSVTYGFTCFRRRTPRFAPGQLRLLRVHRHDRRLRHAPSGRDPRILPAPAGGRGRASAVAARQRRPWVLDVRDLWPDVAVVARTGRGGATAARGPAVRAPSLQIRRRDHGAPPSPPSRQVEARGGEGKVAVDLRTGRPRISWSAGDRAPTIARCWATVTTSSVGPTQGTWAWSQGLETAIDAAGELGEGFQLVLIGDGSRRSDLERLASDVPSDQVVVPRAVPPARGRGADAGLRRAARLAGAGTGARGYGPLEAVSTAVPSGDP